MSWSIKIHQKNTKKQFGQYPAIVTKHNWSISLYLMKRELKGGHLLKTKHPLGMGSYFCFDQNI